MSVPPVQIQTATSQDVDRLGEAFREAMSRLVAGVVMVTTWIDGKPWGLTVSACCSVSVFPPMVLVSLGEQTASARAIRKEQWFGISILGEQLIEVARLGSAQGRPKFVDGFCEEDESVVECRTPMVMHALAHADCRVVRLVKGGDHVIFLGTVESVGLTPRGSDNPLVFYARSYHSLGASTDLGVAPARQQGIDPLLYANHW